MLSAAKNFPTNTTIVLLFFLVISIFLLIPTYLILKNKNAKIDSMSLI